MAYVNVAEWKPDQVTEWLKGKSWLKIHVIYWNVGRDRLGWVCSYSLIVQTTSNSRVKSYFEGLFMFKISVFERL